MAWGATAGVLDLPRYLAGLLGLALLSLPGQLSQPGLLSLPGLQPLAWTDVFGLD